MHLERTIMRHLLTTRLLCSAAIILALFSGGFFATGQTQNESAIKGWKKGVGWGWIWGKDDEVGALNSMTDSSRAAALALAQQGKVYDLGITYSRRSYKWPGHSPGEIISFRSPAGEGVQGEAITDRKTNPSVTRWHSNALFMNDNVATQIDGLGHITAGDDHHWYNGFREAEHGGDFGLLKCDTPKIPPIVARGVLLDIAAARNVDELPAHYAIIPADIEAALARQRVNLRPGDVVLIRTGTLRHWAGDGDNHAKIGEHDSAGITLAAAKLLVEQHGAMLIASDTSGLEVAPAPEGSDSFIPVHKYLLVEQGVHIGEFHFLEDLARDRVYEFCYVCSVNKIAGAVAGFALRPLAMK
jgi:kynurenine formamidase